MKADTMIDVLYIFGEWYNTYIENLLLKEGLK